jgi:hypothetical protein
LSAAPKHPPAPQALSERRRLEALDAAVSRLCSVLRQLLLSVAPAAVQSSACGGGGISSSDAAAPDSPFGGGLPAPFAGLLLGSPERRGAGPQGRADGGGSVALLEELIDVVGPLRSARPRGLRSASGCNSLCFTRLHYRPTRPAARDLLRARHACSS